MSYLVLARKWRPQTFSDLIGQEHVSQTLQNAIETGRVAHAFLFTGARGVGKTSAARILAKALDCQQGPSHEPCNVCPACISITNGNAVDVFEIDGASNTGVEDIRELRENIKYLPSSCRFKIFIIDEVHMLSTNAFNALLKTLEEPPAHVKFIFATTEPHKVPVTILSRCQRFDFRRISLQKIVARLRHIADQEQISISDAALTVIARKGDGSMRDSLSTLDQVLAFCGDTVSDDDVTSLLGVVDRRLLLEASQAAFSRDSRQALAIIKQVDDCGYNMRHFCQELIGHFRNLSLIRLLGDAGDLLDLAEAELTSITVQANGARQEDLQRHLTILLKTESEMASSNFPRLLMEMALVKMCTLAPVVPVQQILDRLKALELSADRISGEIRPPSVEKPASAKPAPLPREVQEAPLSAPTPPPLDEEKSWSGFVAFVMKKKASLGTVLEEGRPLQASATCLKIGFPEKSFPLTRLKDPDTMAAVKTLARQYFHNEPTIELVALAADAKGLPPSVQEKKSLQASEHREKLHGEAKGHPMVVAALDIFGGEISDIQEIEKDQAPTEKS